MSQYFGLDWVAMALTFTAIYLLGGKRRLGFVVMGAGNLCWSTIGVLVGSPAMVMANLGFLAMNLRGFRKWRPPVDRDAAQARGSGI